MSTDDDNFTWHTTRNIWDSRKAIQFLILIILSVSFSSVVYTLVKINVKITHSVFSLIINMKSYPLSALNLPTRTENTLRRNKIHTLNEFVKYDEFSMRKIKQIGQGNIQVIRQAIFDFLTKENDQFANEYDKNTGLQKLNKCLSKFINESSSTGNDEKLEFSNLRDSQQRNLYLQSLCVQLNTIQFSVRDQEIIRKRLRFFNKDRSIRLYSLEEIAQSQNFKVTRERE